MNKSIRKQIAAQRIAEAIYKTPSVLALNGDKPLALLAVDSVDQSSVTTREQMGGVKPNIVNNSPAYSG